MSLTIPKAACLEKNDEDDANSSKRQELLAERKYLKGILCCMLCQLRECNILLIPCGHHKMCWECSDKVEVCPVCSKLISQKVQTYME